MSEVHPRLIMLCCSIQAVQFLITVDVVQTTPEPPTGGFTGVKGPYGSERPE